MKEKLSLMRKAYNFKQSQWLDPTKSFGHFCLSKSWVQTPSAKILIVKKQPKPV